MQLAVKQQQLAAERERIAAENRAIEEPENEKREEDLLKQKEADAHARVAARARQRIAEEDELRRQVQLRAQQQAEEDAAAQREIDQLVAAQEKAAERRKLRATPKAPPQWAGPPPQPPGLTEKEQRHTSERPTAPPPSDASQWHISEGAPEDAAAVQLHDQYELAPIPDALPRAPPAAPQNTTQGNTPDVLERDESRGELSRVASGSTQATTSDDERSLTLF